MGVTDGLYLYLVAYEEDWTLYHQKVKQYKLKMEEQRKRIEEEKKKKAKLKKERKVGVTPELMQKYKRQHKKEKKKKKSSKKMDNKDEDALLLPANDKQTQTEDFSVNTQQTQTEPVSVEQSAEDIARDIVNDLIVEILKEQKQETIITEHIRSVQSTKKILGINTMTMELHRKYFERRFSPQTWYRALSVKSDDESSAKQWIEEHGARSQQIKHAPLVRHLVLEQVAEHPSTDAMFANCMFYCSGHQFVILVPPRTNPWCSNSDKWLGRVYRLRDGAFIQDTKDIALKYQATRAVVDPLRDLIWFGYLQNDLIFQSYQNHGPSACFYEIADNEEEEEEEEEEEQQQQEEKEEQIESDEKQKKEEKDDKKDDKDDVK